MSDAEAPVSQVIASRSSIGRAGARALLGLPARPASIHHIPSSEVSTVPISIEEPATSTIGSIRNLTLGRRTVNGTHRKRKPRAEADLDQLFNKLEDTVQVEANLDSLAQKGALPISDLVALDSGGVDSYFKYREALERGIQNVGIPSVAALDSAISQGFVKLTDEVVDRKSDESLEKKKFEVKEQIVKVEAGAMEQEDDTNNEVEISLHKKLSEVDVIGELEAVDGDPMAKLHRVLLEASQYRGKVMSLYKAAAKPSPNGDLDPRVESQLLFVTAAVINDAWSRRWFDLNRFDTSVSKLAHTVLLHPLFKGLLKFAVLVHMALAIFEPAATFQSPVCGSNFSQLFVLTTVVEGLCLLVYISAIILMQLSFGLEFFFLRKKNERGRKMHPFVTTCVTFCMLLDWILRTSVFRAPKFAFSRVLRPILLLTNTRPLRDMFSSIFRIIPSVLALTIGCFLLMVCFSVVGFHLFHSIYPTNSYPENFDSWAIGTVLLFALFTSENYPECMDGAVQYSIWFAVYFIIFLIVGQSLLTVMLGVVYDSYRSSVTKTALKNYQKEREALTVAFALVAKCPAKKQCSKFPCKHGEGFIDQMTWMRLFSTFRLHPRNTYVYKVFQRNAGGLNNAQVSLIASELFKTAAEKPVERDVKVPKIVEEEKEKTVRQKRSASQDQKREDMSPQKQENLRRRSLMRNQYDITIFSILH